MLSVLTALSLVACAPAKSAHTNEVPSITLERTEGDPVALPQTLHDAKYTVLIFYADACPCFRVHDARIRDLAHAYEARGVRFFLVDSEVGATIERDRTAMHERNLPAFLLDRNAKLADALGAEYATYSVVVDGEGTVRYRGGIDSDKTHLSDDATPYLKNALDDLLAGHAPRVAQGKALGCALQTR